MSYFFQIHKVAMQVMYVKDLWPAAHLHTHVEMIYLEEGSFEAVLDNQRYAVNAGEVLIVFPNQIHAYFEQKPVRGYVAILAPELFPEFHEIFHSKLPENPVIPVRNLPVDAGGYLENARSKLKMKAALSDAVAKGQLLALLGELFLRMNFMEKPGEASAMKNILNYCMDHYSESFALEDMARELYLSKYYICHMFRERLNTSCKEFVNHLRVEAACELLKKGTSITETAYAAGFSSVRTFHRIFSSCMNWSPRDYAKKENGQNTHAM